MKPDTQATTYMSLAKQKINVPKIIFSRNAIKWIINMADIHDTEIGLFGIIDEIEGGYCIRDIFYPKHQEANHGTCEISAEGEALMAEWLLDKGREGDVGKVRFWGHSHGTMGVFASCQDEEQALEMMNRNRAYIIRGIFNKEGKMAVSFYDYAQMRRIDHVKWEIEESPEDVIIKKQIEELIDLLDGKEETKSIRDKITELKKDNFPVTTTVTHSGYGSNGRWYDKEYNKRNAGFQLNNNRSSGGNGNGRGSLSQSWENSGETMRNSSQEEMEFEYPECMGGGE